MKRLLLFCLLSSPAYGVTLKEINDTRIVSGIKAVAATGLGLVAGYVGGEETGRLWNSLGLNKTAAQASIFHLTKAGGMFYTSYLLLTYAWYKARHAIGDI
jgi:hypothetical protein